MGFNKFKTAIRELSIDELKKELEERKKLLFKWNNPIERNIAIGAFNAQTKLPRTYSKHPFDKIRKEIAILNTIITEKS